jgi:hypothetical protein
MDKKISLEPDNSKAIAVLHQVFLVYCMYLRLYIEVTKQYLDILGDVKNLVIGRLK